jgi:hypothetical protein
LVLLLAEFLDRLQLPVLQGHPGTSCPIVEVQGSFGQDLITKLDPLNTANLGDIALIIIKELILMMKTNNTWIILHHFILRYYYKFKL